MTPHKVAIQTAIRNVLFLTDFSVASIRAFPWAVALTLQNHATVHVAHVIEPAPEYFEGESDVYQAYLEDAEAAQQNLNTFLQSNPLHGVPHEQVLTHGELWRCVSQFIAERKIDLVVVGTRGSTGLTKFVLGSGAERIFREVSCPVMTIGPHVKVNARSEFREILFPMEFKQSYALAYPHALAFAAQNHARLTVVHAVLPTHVEFGDRGMAEFLRHTRSLLIKELNQFTHIESSPASLNIVVECGTPPEVILKVARQLSIDLIVMSVHHAKRLATHLPWAVAHEVVAEAPCPVLTIRA